MDFGVVGDFGELGQQLPQSFLAVEVRRGEGLSMSIV